MERNTTMIPFMDTIVESLELFKVIKDIEYHKVENLNRKKQAIYKNLIINLCASFEVHLETVLEKSINFIAGISDTSETIPINVRLRISDNLINQNDKRLIWKISGDGWREELLINHLKLNDKFNTPRPHLIDDYFYKSIGINKVTSNWKWKGQSAKKSKDTLNKFMDMRGNITHRFQSSKMINQKDIYKYLNFLSRISMCTSNTVRNHLYKLTKIYPWEKERLITIIP